MNMENSKSTRGRKKKDPLILIVPVTTYVKKKNKEKAQIIIDKAVKDL